MPEEVANELRGGRFAIAAGLPPADVEALRQDRDYAAGLRESPGFATYFLILNARRGPLEDPEVRRALRRALDVDGIVRAALGRAALPARGLISAGLLGHESVRHKPAPAASAARLAGLELTATVHPVYLGQYGHLWTEIREAFEALGIDLRFEARPMAQTLRELAAGEADLVAARRVAAYPDADAFINPFHSRHGLLGPMIANAEIDRLIEQGRRETDPALRHVVYRRLEEVFAREALVIPLFDEQVCCFARPEVEGLRIRLGWPKIVYEELSLDLVELGTPRLVPGLMLSPAVDRPQSRQ